MGEVMPILPKMRGEVNQWGTDLTTDLTTDLPLVIAQCAGGNPLLFRDSTLSIRCELLRRATHESAPPPA